MSAAGAGIGLAFGLGVLLVASRLAARRPSFDQRLAPYLRPRRSVSALLASPATASPFAVLERLVAPFMADAMRLVTRVSSPNVEVRRRLVRAGRLDGVEQFRVRQVVAGTVGLTAGLAAGLALLAWRHSAVPVLVALVVLATVGGVLVPDWWLTRQVRRRELRLLAELPAVAELLALAVAAGEGAVGAIERVAAAAGGHLGTELSRTVADTRAGLPVTAALDRLAERTGLPALSRLAEALSVAIERGTPLAEVLRAQAQDVREASRRALMETGGRKEVAMMIPVVFLLLPVTIVFAVYPSLVLLEVGL